MSTALPTALELASAIATGSQTASAVLDEHFARIEAHDSEIQAFLSLNKDQAYATAQSVDDTVKAGNASTLPLLAGVPIAIKDNLNVTGTKTTYCGQNQPRRIRHGILL